jgi:hypothetical protein
MAMPPLTGLFFCALLWIGKTRTFVKVHFIYIKGKDELKLGGKFHGRADDGNAHELP